MSLEVICQVFYWFKSAKKKKGGGYHPVNPALQKNLKDKSSKHVLLLLLQSLQTSQPVHSLEPSCSANLPVR